jgi:hypothetical protein
MGVGWLVPAVDAAVPRTGATSVAAVAVCTVPAAGRGSAAETRGDKLLDKPGHTRCFASIRHDCSTKSGEGLFSWANPSEARNPLTSGFVLSLFATARKPAAQNLSPCGARASAGRRTSRTALEQRSQTASRHGLWPPQAAGKRASGALVSSIEVLQSMEVPLYGTSNFSAVISDFISSLLLSRADFRPLSFEARPPRRASKNHIDSFPKEHY